MEHSMGNIFIRPNEVEKAGDFIEGHKHNFDHVTLIRRGRFRIEVLEDISAAAVEGGAIPKVLKAVEKSAGEYVLIRAELVHRLTALEDHSAFLCIYAHRTPQGDVVQEYTGWEHAFR